MKTNTQTFSVARRLTESAIMIALATVLSLLKLVSLPAGGSITAASMVPLILIAYRYGPLWGLFTGFVHGALQLLLDTGVFAYVTGWRAAVAVILLDYLLAFSVLGLGGAFRRVIKNQSGAVLAGTLCVCVARYLCHVLSGATVWAGLSIPSADALQYSFIYNATYMLPEMLIALVVAWYLSGALDFRAADLVRRAPEKKQRTLSSVLLGYCGWALLAGAAVFDTVSVFAHFQGEDGTFDVTLVAGANWPLIALVTGAAAVVAAVLFVIRAYLSRRAAQ